MSSVHIVRLACGDRFKEAGLSTEVTNSKGPKIEPWGTPEVTNAEEDEVPLRTTLLSSI